MAVLPRQPTGSVEVHRWRDGRTVTYRARVRAYGRQHRVTFGTNLEGWSAERARVELDRIVAAVERGTWEPPTQLVSAGLDASNRAENLHVTASRWWARRRDELAPKTVKDYRWRLDKLLAHDPYRETATVDVRWVDGLRDRLRARGLGPRSVNMVLDLLAQVLDDAVEYGLLDANPARGKRRRMRLPRSPRTFLEPDMVVDLLDAAGDWERSLPDHQRYGRRALLATLCLAGPRISELLAVPRARLDLHGGRLRVGEAKTEAGVRDLELTAFLAGELRAHLAGVHGRLGTLGPGAPVFPSRTGGRLQASNVRNRLLGANRRAKDAGKSAVQRVNERRAAEGRMLLPDRVTPHTLRRTFASLALAAGRDPRWVMGQLGHTDPSFTLRVYAQVVQRKRVDEALIWQLMRFPDEQEADGGVVRVREHHGRR